MSNIPAGCSSLHGEDNVEKLKIGIAEGININNTCLSGMTPLHWSRNAETTAALIEAGANVNAWDMNRTTPLHLAPDAESIKQQLTFQMMFG